MSKSSYCKSSITSLFFVTKGGRVGLYLKLFGAKALQQLCVDSQGNQSGDSPTKIAVQLDQHQVAMLGTEPGPPGSTRVAP